MSTTVYGIAPAVQRITAVSAIIMLLFVSLALWDDGLIDLGTCHQLQRQQLQEPRLRKIKGHRAPPSPPRACACDLFEDGVNFNATRGAPQSRVYIDYVMICTGTSVAWLVTSDLKSINSLCIRLTVVTLPVGLPTLCKLLINMFRWLNAA